MDIRCIDSRRRFSAHEMVVERCAMTVIKAELSQKFPGLDIEDFYLVRNGKILQNGDPIMATDRLEVRFRLLGGKGGFGSMLRAIGAQIEKTTNREACRDLSGRRLRDINEEKRLKNWISKQAEREQEKAQKKKDRLERLKQEPKHDFKDDKYFEQRGALPDAIDSALQQGLKNEVSAKTKPTSSTPKPSTATSSSAPDEPSTSAAGPSKRTAEDNAPVKAKKMCLWMGPGLAEDDLSSDSDEEATAGTSGGK